MNIKSINYTNNIQNNSFGKSVKKPVNSTDKFETNKKPLSEKENSSLAVKTLLLGTLLLSLLFPKYFPLKNNVLNNNAKFPYNIKSNSDSDTYNSSVDVITSSSFDYIQENIKSLKEQLKLQSLEETDNNHSQELIEALYKKQKEQNQVAAAYTDGKYVYLHININKEDEDIKDKYEFGINIESLKKLFDIEDGGIENNNELNIREDAYGKYGNGSYKDYTQNWFHDGDIVKVPVSSIKKDNINLSDYYQE